MSLDTLRTHVKGVLTRNPDWESALAGFSVESAWMVGSWDDVEKLVEQTKAQSPSVAMARVLLAMRSGQESAIMDTLSVARSVLGLPITASGAKGYRRSYDAVLDLHLTHELEIIHNAMSKFPTHSQGTGQRMRRDILNDMSKSLSSRLESSLPTLRTREPILSMRRTAFALRSVENTHCRPGCVSWWHL
jgi:serine/threonine-protein kinase ATR